MNQNNDEISQDFENLVGNKGGAGDSDNGPSNEQKLLQQRMMQQQAMQQQAMQQQAMQQQAMQQPNQQGSSDKNTGSVKKEGFMNKFNVKSLSLLGVLFALFYVFSSSQLEGVIKNVPYLSNQQLNLAVRGLLFVVVYFILDKFVL
jgi:hypothetical protein